MSRPLAPALFCALLALSPASAQKADEGGFIAPDDRGNGEAKGILPAFKSTVGQDGLTPSQREQEARVSALIEQLKGDRGRDAVEKLKWFPKPKNQLVFKVVELLKGKGGLARYYALQVLGRWQAVEYAADIVPLVNDPGLEGKEACAALMKMNASAYAPKVAAALVDKAYNERYRFMRNEVYESLANPEKSEFIEKLAVGLGQTLGNPDPKRRATAVELLTIMRRSERTGAIAALLKDPSPEVRKAAALSLGTLGARDQQDALLALAQDPSQGLPLRFASVRSLRALGQGEKARALLSALSKDRPALMREAARYVVSLQDPKDGFWSGNIKDYPRLGATALAAEALEGVLARAKDYGLNDADKGSISRSIEAGRRTLSVPKKEFDPFDVGFALSILSRSPGSRDAAAGLVRQALEKQDQNGAFGHFVYSASFHTAVVLLGLLDAKAAGIAVSETALRRAAASIENSRSGGVYSYHAGLGPMVEGKEASVSRSLPCEMALLRYYDASGEKEKAAESRRALARLLAEHKRALPALEGVASEIGGKREPHSGPDQIATYYYLFGVLYAARALPLADGVSTDEFGKPLEESILSMQNEFGHWEGDEGPAYHTSASILALMALQKN